MKYKKKGQPTLRHRPLPQCKKLVRKETKRWKREIMEEEERFVVAKSGGGETGPYPQLRPQNDVQASSPILADGPG